jgi:hypothetical protein
MSGKKQAMSQKMTTVHFNLYGLKVELQSDDKSTVEGILRDFRYFESPSDAPDVRIEVFNEHPDFNTLPDITASIYSVNYVSYQGDKEIFSDYHGRGLRIFDPEKNHYRIYSTDSDLRHEITYLSMLSATGRFLDSRHIHRVHGLGVCRNGKAIVILLPEKGGKTTIALELLRSGEVGLLSEDSPLINRHGEVLPFPLRLGILPGGESDIPVEYLYEVSFTRVGTKILVDPNYFKDKIASACKAGIILIGERTLGVESKIEPVSRSRAVKELVKNSVIGLGLHQGLEYLLGRSLWQTLGRIGLAVSRFYNCLALVNGCRTYRYFIGHDTRANVNTLLEFLRKFDD